MTAVPPDNVKAAAAVVDAWLAEQQTLRATPEEIARMSFAERLDYARRFKQSEMPAWKDPRTSK
jgi:hypothetical protein